MKNTLFSLHIKKHLLCCGWWQVQHQSKEELKLNLYNKNHNAKINPEKRIMAGTQHYRRSLKDMSLLAHLNKSIGKIVVILDNSERTL